MNLMAELFNMPTATKNQSYPVVVTPSPNGFVLNPVDFNDLTIEADNIQYGISCIQSAIAQKLTNAYPPAPTPTSEINLNQTEFVVMVNI